MQVVVSPKFILQVIGALKTMCEEYGEEFPLDPENLYRHVGALLGGADPPELVPAKIVEVCIEPMLQLRIAMGPRGTDPEQMDAMLAPIGTPESLQAAAEWAFILYRDFFREDPSTGKEDGYRALTSMVHVTLREHLSRISRGNRRPCPDPRPRMERPPPPARWPPVRSTRPALPRTPRADTPRSRASGSADGIGTLMTRRPDG
jgi:hypothetical protein